jgi:hypothetical protein
MFGALHISPRQAPRSYFQVHKFTAMPRRVRRPSLHPKRKFPMARRRAKAMIARGAPDPGGNSRDEFAPSRR